MIRVQTEDFDIQAEYNKLRDSQPKTTGAICTFTGLVRDFGDQQGVSGIYLEHYPGLTENSLQKIVDAAATRWDIIDTTIIHRVGELRVTDQIVFVGVSSSHRADAFAACEFIMDFLKTKAPFWKKELNTEGDHWVEAKESDQQRMEKWQTK